RLRPGEAKAGKLLLQAGGRLRHLIRIADEEAFGRGSEGQGSFEVADGVRLDPRDPGVIPDPLVDGLDVKGVVDEKIEAETLPPGDSDHRPGVIDRYRPMPEVSASHSAHHSAVISDHP